MSETYEIPAIGHSIKRAALTVDVSEESIRIAIRQGNLVPKWLGSKPLIPHDQLKAWFDSLDDEKKKRR